jgi:Ran GTPase-activating protein (RanGAP) involved in mRNA processing and transport
MQHATQVIFTLPAIETNMSESRLSETIASLNETRSVDFSRSYSWDETIGPEGASALAEALQVNTTVTNIDLDDNRIGAEGASEFAEALKVNTSLMDISLSWNDIGAEGVLALADALKVNTSVTNINLSKNGIGDDGASALADALKVNTSVTTIDLDDDEIVSDDAKVDELIARNVRLRHLFFFDARRMLLSVMCADWCGVVWPYLLDSGDTDGIVAPDHVETLRAEFAAVVEERRRREHALLMSREQEPSANVDDRDNNRDVKRRRTGR